MAGCSDDPVHMHALDGVGIYGVPSRLAASKNRHPLGHLDRIRVLREVLAMEDWLAERGLPFKIWQKGLRSKTRCNDELPGQNR